MDKFKTPEINSILGKRSLPGIAKRTPSRVVLTDIQNPESFADILATYGEITEAQTGAPT